MNMANQATEVLQSDRSQPEHGFPSISVIIPARNEAANLPYVLPRIPTQVQEVILVDGHSTDATIQVARELMPTIRVVQQEGKGKGDALRTGVAESTSDILVMLDADGSTDPQEISRFVTPLLHGADFAKGSRFTASGGSTDISPSRRLGNACLNLLVNRLFGSKFTDLCYGYNAFWRDCLDCFEVDASGFEVETLINIRAHRSRLVIKEVPSFEFARIHGQSNLHAVRDGLRILRTIIGEWWNGHSKVRNANASASRRSRVEETPTLLLPAFRLADIATPKKSPATTIPASLVKPVEPVPSPQPGVTVIVPAYTEARWEKLVAVVHALTHQTHRPHQIMVVIDHNSRLLARAQEAFPEALVVENMQARGLSGARNTGISLAQTELVAFIDDDAIPEPTWLETLVAAFTAPSVLGVGGALEPDWQTSRPAWFPDEFGWVVGCDYTGLPIKRAKVRNLIGASMCIRRSAFVASGGFREDIGRIGSRPLGCEETEWCLRAQNAFMGGYFLYEPRARSRHFVPETRTTLSYFSSRCFFEGISKAWVVKYTGLNEGLASERTHVLRTLPQGVLRGLTRALRHGDMQAGMRAVMILVGLVLTVLGYITGRLTMTYAALIEMVTSRAEQHASRPLTLVDIREREPVSA